MALNRLQFGIDCQIGLVVLAAAIPHLTGPAFTALFLSIWHSQSSFLLTESPEAT
jgi:hypothetical protein